jgi:hypothetical protein
MRKLLAGSILYNAGDDRTWVVIDPKGMKMWDYIEGIAKGTIKRQGPNILMKADEPDE